MLEVDDEFEEACWALGTSSSSQVSVPEERPVDEPARPSSVVLTAADLAEDDPAESSGETIAEDLVPTIPALSERPVVAAPAPAPVTNPLTVARAELAATRAELDSLRADLQSERFRFQDERARLEAQLASGQAGGDNLMGHDVAASELQHEVDALRHDLESERVRFQDERSRFEAQLAAVRAGGNDLLDGPSEVLDLRREVGDLRDELSQSQAQHLEDIARLQDEIARLQADLKATQAREAQTVIAAQLAEDELKALRSDDSLEVTRRELTASRAEADALRQVVEELQAREAEHAAGRRRLEQFEAQLADRENDLRISRESAADRIRSMETQLAAKEAELAVTQQELLDAEMRRAEEAASFLAALQN